MSRCSSCDAPIRWAVTERGKPIPLDPDPVVDGNLVFEDDAVRPFEPMWDHERERFVSHFATCPDAAQHRKRP